MKSAGLVLALVLVGCGSRPFRGEGGPPKAVVFSLPSQDAESERLAVALHDKGYDVVRKSTTLTRERTSIGVYDARRHPERVEEVTKIAEDLGLKREVVLPFQQHATGGNAVVAWLGADAVFK